MKKTLLSFVVFTIAISAAFAQYPQHIVGTSEYPSWSALSSAHEYKLIDKRPGKYGPIEHIWKVDIVLVETDYDSTLGMYNSGSVDAVCITNIDIMAIAGSIDSVAVFPTSTSYGGDACIVTGGVSSIDELKGKAVFGLKKSVSEYLFNRYLQINGKSLADYKFVNKDPAIAALAMQQKSAKVKAMVVWNPFLLATLDQRKDARTLFSSRSIPCEILDLIVISKKSLKKKGSNNFVCALIDTFYQMSDMLENPKTKDDAISALSEKFCNVEVKVMRKALKQTLFYKTPKMALDLFTNGHSFPGNQVKNPKSLKKVMQIVEEYSINQGAIKKGFKIGYGSHKKSKANLIFDPTYIQEYQKRK